VLRFCWKSLKIKYLSFTFLSSLFIHTFDTMVGKTILHYKILEKIGEGGMGVVYKAEDTKLKRIVAIKFLLRQISISDEERERFKIEA